MLGGENPEESHQEDPDGGSVQGIQSFVALRSQLSMAKMKLLASFLRIFNRISARFRCPDVRDVA